MKPDVCKLAHAAVSCAAETARLKGYTEAFLQQSHVEKLLVTAAC
jgi:hypothetical protein